MPEGDNIFRAARALHRALAGCTVVRFESVLPALTRVDADRPLAGRTVESVSSRGKHLLMCFSGDLILHTHLRMNGSWQIYRAGERWRRPARDMRIVVATREVVAVGFNVPVAEFLSAKDVSRHRDLRRLGPDLLDEAFDRSEVLRRMRERGADAVGDVLLNQRVLAGIGNILKSEILFVSAIDPFTATADLSDAALERILDVSRRLITVNSLERSRSLRAFGGRVTTGNMSPANRLWVYGRGGQACRKCGAIIQSRKTGLDARLSYWCPVCQRSASSA